MTSLDAAAEADLKLRALEWARMFADEGYGEEDCALKRESVFSARKGYVAGWTAALQSAEVRALIRALERCADDRTMNSKRMGIARIALAAFKGEAK
jgi:hypothetical protein